MIAVNLDNLDEHIKVTHVKIAEERDTLMKRFREEFSHEPKPDNGKLDRVLDGMIGPEVHPLARPETIRITVMKRKPGRPKGAKNKPKPQLVPPQHIGYLPDDDLIIRRH